MRPSPKIVHRLMRCRAGGGPNLVRPVFALLLAMLLLLAVATPAAAAEFRSGDDVDVPTGETIDDDVYLAGATVTIAGTVTRDAVAAAEDIEVTGRIDGNLNAAGNQIDVRGPVGRSIRAAGNEIRVFGTVGGDVVAAGSTVTIEPGASVTGDVVVGAGDAEILGEVGGDVRAGGRLYLDAPVGGEVRVAADEIELGSNARVAGALYYDSDEAPEIAEGAVVSGPVEERDLDDGGDIDPGFGLGGFWFDIGRLLAALVAGIVIILLLPRGAVAVADVVRERPLPTFLLGLGLLVLLPILLLILMVTVVGIPIALIGLALYFAALYLSQVFVGLALGRFALRRSSFGEEAGRGINIVAMALGVIFLTLLRLIPYVDVVVAIITALLGLGALALTLRRRRGGPLPVAGTPVAPQGLAD